MQYLVIILMVFGLTACSTQSDKTVEHSFYYWKTQVNLSQEQQEAVAGRPLYMRYRDIGPGPGGWEWKGPAGFVWETVNATEVVPVFFIVNKVFQELNEAQRSDLARKCIKMVEEQTPDRVVVRELQFDCDWSASTRIAYFDFLEKCRSAAQASERMKQVRLSVTIRMHQIRYANKTGVPPVERGMLMVYNLENPTDAKVRNAILDLETLKAYTSKSSTYGLPLDVALPLFSWAVQFRGDRFQAFVRGMRRADADTCAYLSRHEKNIYRVVSDTELGAVYLRTGDWLRIEEPNLTEIQDAWKLVQAILPNDSCRIAFFDLSENSLRQFPLAELTNALK